MIKFGLALSFALTVFASISTAQNQPNSIINGDPVVPSPNEPAPPPIGRIGDAFDKRCAATLLSPEWAITAAHCVEEAPTHFYFSAFTALVTEVKIFPGYTSEDPLRNDVALVKVRWTDGKRPATISPPLLGPRPAHGDIVRVYGWGATDPTKPSPSEQLLFADVKVTPCNSKERASGAFCTAPNNKGQTTCQGDSGGPVMTIDEKGRAKLVGIISGGETLNCGQDGRAAVQTSLADRPNLITRFVEQPSARAPLKIPFNYHINGVKFPTVTLCLDVNLGFSIADNRGYREYNVVGNRTCNGKTNQLWYRNPWGNLVSYDGPDNGLREGRVFMYVKRRKSASGKTNYDVRASQVRGQTSAFVWTVEENGQIRSERYDQMCLGGDVDRVYGNGLDLKLKRCR